MGQQQNKKGNLLNEKYLDTGNPSTQLKLENQICFPLYAVSRLVIKHYKPLLDELDVTYPQYLVLLILWQKEQIPIKEISQQLYLETNTLTPLLKRMQNKGILERRRSEIDERIVIISLTEKGKQLQNKAIEIPKRLIDTLNCISTEEEVYVLKKILDKMLFNIVDIACDLKKHI